MPTYRDGGSNSDLFSRKSTEYFEKFGQTNITWNTFVETRNASGRLLSRTVTATTIIGDLQFNSKLLKEYIQLGVAQLGDGFFYTQPTNAIKINDEIVLDGVTWKLVSQVEGEYLGNSVPYIGFVARRKPDA